MCRCRAIASARRGPDIRLQHDTIVRTHFMTYFVLITLTTLSAVLQPPPIISLQSSVTIETRLASVYHTHVPRRTHRRSQSWNKHAWTRSRVYYASLLIGYCTAAVDKRVRSASLYHCRQCSIVLKPRSDRIDYTVVCFTTHDTAEYCENTVRPVRAECGLNLHNAL